MSRPASDPLRLDGDGLHCPAGGFHVDPRRPVPRAIVTHAHSDHARPGSGEVLAAEPAVPLLERRLNDGGPGRNRKVSTRSTS